MSKWDALPVEYRLESARDILAVIEKELVAAYKAGDHDIANIMEGVLDHAKKDVKDLEIELNG